MSKKQEKCKMLQVQNTKQNILHVHALCITEHNLNVCDTLLPRSAKSMSLKFQIPVGKSNS
jgi:hypothetical protein